MRKLSALLLLALIGVAHAGLITIAGGRGSGSSSSDDWTTRSTATGVILADRLQTQAKVDDWFFNDSTGDHVFLDASIKPTGAAGSFGFEILNSDTSGSGSVTIPFGDSFGEGETFWVSYRVYFQPDDGYAPWLPNVGEGPDGTATKLSVLSRDGNGAAPTGAFQLNEVVIQVNYTAGQIDAYRQHGGAYDPFVTNISSNCNGGSEYQSQMEVDRGNDPLTGTNPDTGAAWSTCEQDRAQYGSLYGARSNVASCCGNYKPGIGDPFSGGFRAYPGEWLTLTQKVVIGTFQNTTANSHYTLLAARDGEAYEVLIDEATTLGINGGDSTDHPPYNGIWLLPYTTERDNGGRQVSTRGGELAACFDIWNVSPTHDTGAGTLSWNASTSRMTWQANGDSAGTARGYSVANDILAVNLISSDGANYLNGKFTPASCPGGNTTESVTIGTDRPDTQRNYADLIVSTSPINAPGGFAPP